MAIDNPIDALETLNRSEERQRAPISRFSKQFLAAAKLLAPPGAKITLDIFGAAEWISNRSEANRDELISVLATELKYCGSKVQELQRENDEQRRFLEDELPSLIVDALRRAEECRAKVRIGRLARILSHAALSGAEDGADAIEEMMSGLVP